jgi:hypothetical protein
LVLPTDISPACHDLLAKLLVKDPSQRLGSTLGAIELKSHPFFSDVDWGRVLAKTSCERPPQPYLVEVARGIVEVSPYVQAGHPQTRGQPIGKESREYLRAWSFINDRL